MRDVQQRIKTFCEQYDMISPPEHRALDMMSELGEVSKELLKMSDYGKRPIVFQESVVSELGDVLFSLIALANTLDVDLETALNGVLGKYEKRLIKGSAGSENE